MGGWALEGFNIRFIQNIKMSVQIEIPAMHVSNWH